jgi:PadR family transcriptional regulator PadR
LGNRDLMSGFVRLHVLHHASTGPIFGIGIIERLAFHGYVLSPGTLYPILHGLEKEGLLRSRGEVVGKKRRRIYDIREPPWSRPAGQRVRPWRSRSHQAGPVAAGRNDRGRS